MTRAKWLVACVAMLAVVGVVVAAPSIGEIMEKCHKVKTGLRAKIKTAAEAASPNWTSIQKMSKEFVEQASSLDKNDPPQGDKNGWKKMCTDYVKLVKELDAAAAKKDAKGLVAVDRKLGASCKGCHDIYQP